MSRLPNINSDTNTWGTVLNDFLMQSLNPDGTLGPIDTPLNFTDVNNNRRAQFCSVSGDLWFLVNSYWDPVQNNFYRIDQTHAAFGFQLQAVGLIPGEPDLGYYVAGSTMWVAQPESYTLIRAGGNPAGGIFGFVGGWELGWTLTQQRQLTIGGGGMEIDGYGTIPYGRVINNTTGTVLAKRLIGMAQNAYTSLEGYDDATLESWYWGYVKSFNPASGPPYPVVPGTDHWCVAYIPPNTGTGTGTFNEFLSISNAGAVTVRADPTTNLGVATKQYVDTRSARGGEASFTGNGSATTFNIAHGIGAVPSRAGLTPMNQASVGCWYTKDATNVIVHYATAPGNGVAINVAWSAWP
jgi:hypothetical protein